MRRFLRTTLRAHDYQVVEAASAREGLAQAAGRNPDVILLDLGLPDLDGLDVTREIRRSASTPIIVISARGQEHDKVTALDLGADDYLTKPFGASELLARIRVALKHSASPPGTVPQVVFQAGELRVDLARRQVFRVRRGGAPHPDRVQAAGGIDTARRQSHHPPAAAPGGLGRELCGSDPLSAGLHGPASPQTGA